MDNQLDNKQKFIDFMNNYKKINSDMEQLDRVQNSDLVKNRQLSKEVEGGKSKVIDEILGKIYKDALPFEDPERSCSPETLGNVMRDFINKRCGKDSEYYVREAIKKNNSPTLKKILLEAETRSKDFLKNKGKNIGHIDIASITFKPLEDKELEDISRRMSLDEISNVIHNNVQTSLQNEIDKAKKEEEYNKQIQDELAKNDEVKDETSMESALSKMKPYRKQKVYQPSLFESILIGNGRVMTEASTKEVMMESIREFTKLNLVKALKLESFNISNIKKMADSYL